MLYSGLDHPKRHDAYLLGLTAFKKGRSFGCYRIYGDEERGGKMTACLSEDEPWGDVLARLLLWMAQMKAPVYWIGEYRSLGHLLTAGRTEPPRWPRMSATNTRSIAL